MNGPGEHRRVCRTVLESIDGQPSKHSGNALREGLPSEMRRSLRHLRASRHALVTTSWRTSIDELYACFWALPFICRA